MISDLLISVNANHRDRIFRNLPIPIQKFNLRLPMDAKYTITDVRQKTVRVCDKFILSYAGVVSQAEYVIDHFRTLTRASAPSEDMFNKEILRLVNAGKVDKNFSLIALIEGSGRIYAGTFNVFAFRSRKFRCMRAGGSGATDLLDVFSSYRGKHTNRGLNSLEEGLGLSLGLSSVLLGKELVTGESLERAYGGFYEISYWNGGDFEKLNDVLHVHWVFQHQPRRGLGFNPPVKIQKLAYHDSLLYLRDIELTIDKKTADTVYIVREPGNLRGAQPQKIKPSLSYKWIVNHLYILLQNGKVRYKNDVRYIQDNNYTLSLDERSSELQLDFRSDYFDFVKDVIAELESN